MKKHLITLTAVFLMVCLFLAGCGAGNDSNTGADDPDAAYAITGLHFDHEMELENATCFRIYYYQGGFKMIDVPLSGRYLVVPEGAEVPAELPDDMRILKQPLENVYMAATGSMSFLEQLEVLDHVTMSSLDENGWEIEGPRQAIREGKMFYAGKYSAPDFEMMVSKNCSLAIESTMILHTPEVQEMIEKLDIPVFIDRSSYEADIFGRIEWIKAYAAMFDAEQLGEELFNRQKAVLDDLQDFENTGRTVAFFAVNSNRTITTRVSDDFIPNMIELAGGRYIFDDLINPDSNSASIRMSFEEFYNSAVNADYIIYNGTIEEPLRSVDDLIGKNELFSEFRAVKENNVWTVDSAWYQSTATLGYLITDLNRMLTGGDPSEMVFLNKVE